MWTEPATGRRTFRDLHRIGGRLVLVWVTSACPLLAHGPLTDVQVSPPAAGPAAAQIENETTIVHLVRCPAPGAPEFEDVTLVAYNDLGAAPSTISIDRSIDGGVTFTPTAVPPGTNFGDPVLAVGSMPPPFPDPPPCGDAGDPMPPSPPVFLALMIPPPPAPPLPAPTVHVGVATSVDGGATWGAPVSFSPTLAGFQDKPWIDVDQGTNTPYVCWTDWSGAPRIRMSGGVFLNQPLSGPRSHGCQLQVDEEAGKIYLTWITWAGPAGAPAMMFTSCDIAGPPCATPAALDSGLRFSPYRPGWCGGRTLIPGGGNPAALGPILGPADIRNKPFPALTIDASDFLLPAVFQTFLVAWNDNRFAVPVNDDGDALADEDPVNGFDDDLDGMVDEDPPTVDMDIVVASSTDGGVRWGLARRVNDDPPAGGADQFMPAIRARRGPAKLQWYDRREAGGGTSMRLWGAFSVGGGFSWTNAPISDVLFPPAVATGVVAASCYMGDYNGIFFDAITTGPNQGPHYLHAWGDNRNPGGGLPNQPDVFFDLQDQEVPTPPPGGFLPDQMPSFSVAAGGPSSLPTSGAPFHPADILRRVPGGAPQVGIACAALGLTADGCDDGSDGDLDELRGLTYGLDFLPDPLHRSFAAFSVAPGSQGVASSPVALEAGCSPSEPQADEFVGVFNGAHLQAFDGDGVSCSGPSAPGLGLVETPASDDLDALDERDPTLIAPAGTPTSPVYFTLGAGSPSLAAGLSPAHIVQTVGGLAPTVYATPSQLGLAAGDEISDLCLLEDGDQSFDSNDLLFYTLTPASPTLAALGASAADVLVPPPAGGAPQVVIPHDALGLVAGDALDALKCQLPWLLDLALAGALPTSLSAQVGSQLTVGFGMTLSNQGPTPTIGEVWAWVESPPEVTVTWVAEPGDECIGPPGGDGPAISLEPAPLVDCDMPPVQGLHFLPVLPVTTLTASRDLELTCGAVGTFEIELLAGLRGLDPPNLRDNQPTNDAFTATLEVSCLGPGSLQLAASGFAAAEEAGQATILVSRLGGSDGAASVDFATADGTATAGQDYSSATGTLSWADGEAGIKSFTVDLLTDTEAELDETVALELSNPSGAALGSPSTAELVILDDDALIFADGFESGDTSAWSSTSAP